MHQRYPTYVIECEGANIAMDDVIVASIYVWKEAEYHFAGGEVKPEPARRGGNGGFGFMRKRTRN
jgi:hypothetical protein